MSAPSLPAAVPCLEDRWPYLSMARPQQWAKNLLVWLGAALAWFFELRAGADWHWPPLLAGFLSVCFIASSNYVLNELLDAGCDVHHPDKRQRPAVTGAVARPLVLGLWLLLASLGLGVASLLGAAVFYVAAAFFAMGIAYNVPPLRLKDRVYLDGLAEALNSPLRILFGWSLVTPAAPPAPALLLAFWAAGAVAMTQKRLDEFRSFTDPAAAAAYRRSFGSYNERKLRLCRAAYAALALAAAFAAMATYFGAFEAR